MAVCAAQGPVKDSPAVEARVERMLAKLTLDEKLAVIGGDRSFFIRALPSIGMPELKMSDGPYGVRTFSRSTAYAAGVSLAAAWDAELSRRVGESMGRDARARGVHVLLAPGVNIYRSPLNGRNFEYSGEDPYLAARTAVGFIEGVQSTGVVATVKHFAANNSEYDRHNLNSVVDERTLRELYLPAFEDSVKLAHVGAVMDSYNLLNGEHLTQSSAMNNDLLKHEWGFDGMLMSDWSATYDTVGAANGGLDIEMPSGKLMNPADLKIAMAAGKVSQATIDDKVRRILRVAVRFCFFDRPQQDVRWSQYDSGGDTVTYEAALGSITLLRNEHALLPLDVAKLHTIAVIGPNAEEMAAGGGSSLVHPYRSVSLLDGVAQHVGDRAKVLSARGVMKAIDVFSTTEFEGMTQEVFAGPVCTGKPRSTKTATQIKEGRVTLVDLPLATDTRCVRWTGMYVPKVSGPFTVLASAAIRDGYTVRLDGREVIRQAKAEDQNPNSSELLLKAGAKVRVEVEYVPDSDVNRIGVGIRATSELIDPEVKAIAKAADVVVLALGFNPDTEAESRDRTYALPYGQAELVRQVHAANPKTVVAVASGGAYETADWLADADALIQTYYPGQEGGRAFADVLFGHSPEGRLPFSFERRLEDNPTFANYYPQPDAPGPKPSVEYREGLFVGYRYYTSKRKPVLYPFGYGLSYTRFRLDGLRVGAKDGAWTAEFDVTNTGAAAGTEVAQLYVGEVAPKVVRPVRELKGFAKMTLQPGETRHVVLALDRRAFSHWDVVSKMWKADAGAYTVEVGESAVELPLKAVVQVP